MMKCLLVAALAAGAVGCTSKADDAEAQYNLVAKHGTLAEACAKAGAVRDAYLAAHDESNYGRWQVKAEGECRDAQLHGGDMAADGAIRSSAEQQALDVETNSDAQAAKIMDDAEGNSGPN